MMRCILPAQLALGACTPAVKYGKVAHSSLAAGEECNPTAISSQDFSTKPLFAVTTRLPDCTKPGSLHLTSHRTDRLRYARFAAPAMKAKKVDTAIQQDADWWAAQGKLFSYLVDLTNMEADQHDCRKTWAKWRKNCNQSASCVQASPAVS
jgi:hypothetical protein